LFSCDLDGSNVGEYDLSEANGQIVPGGGFTISYHPTMNDAEMASGVLPNTGFTSPPTTVFARVESNDGCFVTAELDLMVTPLPEVNPTSLSECFQSADGVFDIDALIPAITGGAVDVTTTFHTSQADASLGIGSVSSPFNTGSGVLNTTIFARVVSDISGCFDTTIIDLEVVVAPDTSITTFENCEIGMTDASDFDLDELVRLINADTGGNTVLFATEADAQAEINPIGGVISSFGETVWANIQTSIPNCDGIRPIDLVVNQAPLVNDIDVQNCLLSDNPNEFVFDFTTLSPGFDYTVHATIADANSGNSPEAFPINTTSDTEQFFLRTENQTTGCHSVSEFNLLVVDFIDNPLPTMMACFGDFFELPDGRRVMDDGQFTVRNVENCTNDIFDIDFQVCNPEEFCQPLMPSGFSPGSTVNANDAFELLEPKGCILQIERVDIFNRWGEKVFEAFGNDFSWDGTFNNAPAQQGVYIWHIDYSFIDDQGVQGAQSRDGSVFLLR